MKKVFTKFAIAASFSLVAISSIAVASTYNWFIVTDYYDAQGNSIGVMVDNCNGSIELYGETTNYASSTYEAEMCW